MDRSLLHLLQTTDSAFPVGGFAHSYGLEGMVQTGIVNNSTELASFIENSWLSSITHIDFPIIRLCAESAHDEKRLFELDQLATACRATAEIRKAQQQMGSQRLRLIAQLSGNETLLRLDQQAAAKKWTANWPCVWGVESAVLTIPLDNMMQAYGYQSLFGLLTAALKLISIGPTEVQSLLAKYAALLPRAIEASHTITEENIGWFTPALDIASARHEHAYSRIFIS